MGFRLIIDETGRVIACEITLSSGSAILDSSTCSLMRRRARFLPGRDEQGEPVVSSWASRMRWELPEEVTVPVESWAATLRFVISPDGQLASCSYREFGAPKIEDRSPCVDISEVPATAMRRVRGRSKGAVTLVIQFRHEVAGMAMPGVPALSARFKPVTQWSGSFSIDPFGNAVNCTGAIDQHDLPIPAVTCLSYTRYERTGQPHEVTTTIGFFTDGDPNIAAALPALTNLAD